MGQGNGQVIKNDNVVAYQTRYEKAGLGPSTHIKFMTDGILLQEIQSDLLLRKYGSIVIDEAHERNLNTDVLLGLLSAALPMRRKAAEEGSLPPLKLIIMSATLRVEDFTENERLFPDKNRRPALVKVPGRTYPVSIHHSKVTELDDYEMAAFDKICKIHRKLPAGGILCFLTGKQEIVRTVNRLRQKLEPLESGKPDNEWHGATDTNSREAGDEFRDMDDEEADGDFFQNEDEDHNDFEHIESNCIDDVEVVAAATTDGDDKGPKPKKVRILPLYSHISTEEQAKVFAPVPGDTRLIVVATNIAETSITIPGISYVVDSGRKKERNYHAGTGIASYDVMWISKAAADQRAGRAGRTGPGHCYRLFSSSVYSRVFDQFAVPEVLTRPLEDIVLAMKKMSVSNVTQFPFPTSPEQSQINAAVRLLANLACVDISNIEEKGGDGEITDLGRAISQLPLHVRYGKMLLVAAQANVLDYAITLVAVLSEATPFTNHFEKAENDKAGDAVTECDELDEIDRNQVQRAEKERKKEIKLKWSNSGGDVLAAMMAAGAYAFAAERNKSDKLACQRFCEEHGLNLVVMQRIAKLRLHLCKLAKARLPKAGGIAKKIGENMAPPNNAENCVLMQAIASGLLDHIARRAPPGALPTEFAGISRSAYISANSKLKEPLYIDNNSTTHSIRPEWICYDSILRKKKNDGTTVAIMQRITPIDPCWLSELCNGSNLLKIGDPLSTPIPRYIKETDIIQCAVETKFGCHDWEVPPLFVDMNEVIRKGRQKGQMKQTSVRSDETFRWFSRYLFEGKIFSEFSGLSNVLNDEPAIITRRKPSKKVTLLLSALSQSGVDSAVALQNHWAERDNKFLFKELKPWIKKGCAEEAKQIWIAAVKARVEALRTNQIAQTTL
jgi:ATP-dependent RNA helicase DHX37/DHR1